MWADKGATANIESVEGVYQCVFITGSYSVFIDERYDPETVKDNIYEVLML